MILKGIVKRKLNVKKIWELLISFVGLITFNFFSRQFISFSITGLLGAIIQVSSTNFLKYLFNFSFNQVITFSTLLSIIFAYLVNNYFTFKNNSFRGKYLIKGFIKNSIVNVNLLLLRIAIAIYLFNVIAIDQISAQILAILICFVFRYNLSKKFIWNNSNNN